MKSKLIFFALIILFCSCKSTATSSNPTSGDICMKCMNYYSWDKLPRHNCKPHNTDIIDSICIRDKWYYIIKKQQIID